MSRRGAKRGGAENGDATRMTTRAGGLAEDTLAADPGWNLGGGARLAGHMAEDSSFSFLHVARHGAHEVLSYIPSFLRRICRSGTDVGDLLQQYTRDKSYRKLLPPTRAAPLPIPPPFVWSGPLLCLHPSRMAKAIKVHRRQLWVNMVCVGYTSWFLRGARTIPAGAEQGRVLNPAQLRVVRRIQHFIGAWRGMAPLPGRAVGKTVHLAAMLAEIRSHLSSGRPTAEKANVLADGFASILPELSPYGRRTRGVLPLSGYDDGEMMRDDPPAGP
jgi:hypothetical protein